MDFTQMPVSQGYTYLLVMIDTFTGWIGHFPTRTEKTEEVVKKLLHELILRFGLSRSLQSDNAAKSLQSCPTLCDPIDGSPLGSSVPGILQARILEWIAISFSNA